MRPREAPVHHERFCRRPAHRRFEAVDAGALQVDPLLLPGVRAGLKRALVDGIVDPVEERRRAEVETGCSVLHARLANPGRHRLQIRIRDELPDRRPKQLPHRREARLPAQGPTHGPARPGVDPNPGVHAPGVDGIAVRKRSRLRRRRAVETHPGGEFNARMQLCLVLRPYAEDILPVHADRVGTGRPSGIRNVGLVVAGRQSV